MGFVVRGDPVGDLWRSSLCLYSCRQGLHWEVGCWVNWYGLVMLTSRCCIFPIFLTILRPGICCEFWWRT
jgi:hypothetical protein